MILITIDRANLPPLRLSVAYIESVSSVSLKNGEVSHYQIVMRSGRTYAVTPSEIHPVIMFWDKIHQSLLRQMENETD